MFFSQGLLQDEFIERGLIMAKNQEEIRATVPAGNAWHSDDLETKAKKHDMKKGDFILQAVDTFMHLTEEEVDDLRVFLDARRLVMNGLKINHCITLTATLLQDDGGLNGLQKHDLSGL